METVDEVAIHLIRTITAYGTSGHQDCQLRVSFAAPPGLTRPAALELLLTCAMWRVTLRDDSDNSPQGLEAAF
jgi:hypothetical protein